MAVSSSFKQQCPSCEAMISIKEGMLGKKVECTKCKDKFIAKKPEEDDELDAEEETVPKKSAKAVGKKTATAVASKSPPGRRAKVEVDDDDDETAPAKNGKAKSKKSDDDDDDGGGKKGKKKDNKKLTIGLALAGVGVVLLIVAAVFVLRGGRNGNSANRNSGGGGGADMTQGGNDKKNPNQLPGSITPGEASAVPFSDAELVKLTNLLPGDTEHVFHPRLSNLFDPAGSLRSAVFETPGALDDAELKKKLGFSVLAIDDMITTSRTTVPWTFTVIHFKDVIKEEDLKTPLKLKAVSKAVEGQNYFKMTEPNPWFDRLATFSFGVPAAVRSLEPPANRPSFVRLHNAQTLIIADEAPMLAFLKAKGQFPQLSTPAAPVSNPPAGGMTGGTPMPGNMMGTSPMPMPGNMMGTSPMPMPGNMMGTSPMPMPGNMMGTSPMPMPGNMMGTSPMPMPGNMMGTSPMPMPGNMMGTSPMPMPGNMMGTSPMPMPGNMMGTSPMPMPGNMTGTSPMPNPTGPQASDPNPAASPSPGDTYMTIKPSLKAILDRMETRGHDGKDKVLFSSATDMDATCLDIKSPEKGRIARKARCFWDVTLLIHETKPHIRYLGTSLIQRDTLKFRLRNEITCGEGFAKDVTEQLNERGAKSVARFIQQLVGHEVRLVAAAPPGPPPAQPPPMPFQPMPMPMPYQPMPMPQPPAGGQEVKPDDKKSTEPTSSQITVTHSLTTVDFVLDLLLENAALTQARGITALTASVLRVQMDAASVSLRHQLAAAGKAMAEKGLSQRQIQVPAGQLPPGAFQRLRDPDSTKPPPIRVDREPKNRISFMAGMLPYLGHQNLFDKIQFHQSWRDPGNWMAGRTVVPQFLDPTYPESARQVAFGDLPIDFAATHYVGIAGVGLDAASYKRGDPATEHLRGPFSYDSSAALADFKRGTANSILMIQVPHDSVTGVSPWIAGGGATLRGVPEKKSIAPFVSANKDKKRGTYAMMADGSVRFIDQSISDEAFKAMCTLGGPAPDGFDVTSDPNTPLIPAPKNLKDAKEQKAAPVKVPPIETKPIGKEPEKTPAVIAPMDDAKQLQGVWTAISLEAGGKPAPDSLVKAFRLTIKGDKMLLRINAMREDEHTFKIDPAKSPKHLDFTKVNASLPPSLSIYELKNGELKVCLSIAGNTAGRPSGFTTQPSSGLITAVLRKQSP